MVEPQKAIEIQAVSLWYGTFQALFEVDLEVASGSITALIGPSGCGKSTLLRSVNRINERLGGLCAYHRADPRARTRCPCR